LAGPATEVEGNAARRRSRIFDNMLDQALRIGLGEGECAASVRASWRSVQYEERRMAASCRGLGALWP
jgi:hypothetical protein